MKSIEIPCALILLIGIAVSVDMPYPYYIPDVKPQNISIEAINSMCPDLTPYYKEDVFDCSNIAAYCQWYLTNLGIKCYIVANPNMNHSYLKVYSSNGTFMLDTCCKDVKHRVVYDKNLEYYNTSNYVILDIYYAVQYNPKEFDWWDNTIIPLQG